MNQTPFKKPGFIAIISGPAGSGKSSLVSSLCKEFPAIQKSISCTTRKPRLGEKEGVDYYFLTFPEFLQKKEAGAFIETVYLFGNWYGTLKAHIIEQKKQGPVVLVIDVEGALQVARQIEVISIFILPPSLVVLKERLERRGTESPAEIEIRLKEAEKELCYKDQYTHKIMNQDWDTAYKELRQIFLEENSKL